MIAMNWILATINTALALMMADSWIRHNIRYAPFIIAANLSAAILCIVTVVTLWNK